MPHTSTTILITEDNPLNLCLFSDTLSHFGATVLTAPTAEEALKILSHPPHKIDILITDILLPHHSGLWLIKQLAHIPHLKELKIILISAIDKETFQTKNHQLPPYTYLKKPVDIQELIRLTFS